MCGYLYLCNILTQIHPESNQNQDVTLVCKKTKGSFIDNIYLEDILPDVKDYDFEIIGK